MPITSHHELGGITSLGVNPRDLESLGKRLLQETKRSRFIGWTTIQLEERRRLNDITALSIPEAVGRVAQIVAPDSPPLQILGVDIVRGQVGGTRYTRPQAEDAPRDEASQARLAAVTHAHVPLKGEVRLTAPEGHKYFVQPGEVVMAGFGMRYAVDLPRDVLSLELVLSPDSTDPSQAWEAYCLTQPSPVLG